MGLWIWLDHNWFELLQTFAIIATFSTTVHTIRRDEVSRHVANAVEITKGHRELWTRFADTPELSSIFDQESDIVSRTEQIFITHLILHLKLVYRASQSRMYDPPESLAEDIRMFFAHPKPRSVWEKSKHMHDRQFVAFVESCLNENA